LFFFFFGASARLNMKRILNGQRKDQGPKELLLPQFPQPTETFIPFAVYFLFSALFCQKFGHHFFPFPCFFFRMLQNFFVHFKWAWCPAGKNNWATELCLPLKSFGGYFASGVLSLSAFSHYALCSTEGNVNLSLALTAEW